MTLQGASAVVVGFAVMALFVGVGTAGAAALLGLRMDEGRPPSGYLPIDFAIGMSAALSGGAVAGWIAPLAPLHHAAALSALVLGMAVVCLVSYGDKGPPRWYQAVLSLSSAVVVIAGAWLVSP